MNDQITTALTTLAHAIELKSRRAARHNKERAAVAELNGRRGTDEAIDYFTGFNDGCEVGNREAAKAIRELVDELRSDAEHTSDCRCEGKCEG